MKERSPIEAKVIAYAFNRRDMDLDRAALVVLREEMSKPVDGLYERLFGKRRRMRDELQT